MGQIGQFVLELLVLELRKSICSVTGLGKRLRKVLEGDRIKTLVSMVTNSSNRLNDHLFGKELFIRFTASAFRKLPHLVISLLVLRAGCGISLYQFLIIAYHFYFV